MKNIYILYSFLLSILFVPHVNCSQYTANSMASSEIKPVQKIPKIRDHKDLSSFEKSLKQKKATKITLAPKNTAVVNNPFDAQNAITFPVCKVEKAKQAKAEVAAIEAVSLRAIPPRNFHEKAEKPKTTQSLEKKLEPEILCFNSPSKKLIPCNGNPLVEAIYLAHAQHHPLVLSPDMIWLLIVQGFAVHANENAESLRYLFVDFEAKQNLDVQRFSYEPHNKTYWEEMFPDFSRKIKENTHKDLMDLVVANFSTTGGIEKAAFEVSLMDAMSQYFQYSITVLCGIPEITLEGTAEDWQDIKSRAEKLNQYQLGWWTKELLPILDQFIKAAEGENNQKFWASIYDKKYITSGCTSEPYITGWILQFFPYIEQNQSYIRNPWIGKSEQDFLEAGVYNGPFLIESDLPTGLSKADVLLNNNGAFSKLKFYAGFTGIQQDQQSLALRPEISWVVVDTKKSPTTEEMELYEKDTKGSLPSAKN